MNETGELDRAFYASLAWGAVLTLVCLALGGLTLTGVILPDAPAGIVAVLGVLAFVCLVCGGFAVGAMVVCYEVWGFLSREEEK